MLWLRGLIIPCVLIYTLCLIRFLAAFGTPAIFFTRHLLSRSPMYFGVLLAIFGQGLIIYGFTVWICSGNKTANSTMNVAALSQGGCPLVLTSSYFEAKPSVISI